MARDYGSEYARRNERARAAGYESYGHQRRFGNAPQSVGTRVHQRRRVHEAVGVGTEQLDDWQLAHFGSSRVDRARYSASRRELQVHWTNSPSGVPYPPYIYDAVDQAVWSSFQASGSPGSFINHTLNSYPYRPAAEIRTEF